MVSAAHKRRAVRQVVEGGLCSVRSACRMLHLHRSSFRYEALRPTEWERRLHGRVEVLSFKHPRLGYKKLTRMLVGEGWRVGKKMVQRLRREMGLKVRPKRPRVRRRGRSSGPQPTRARGANHVWSWDFIHDRTDNGAKLKILSLVDEHTRECLALHAAREMNAGDVIAVLERVIAKRGAPSCIRSDNGPEFIAKELQAWLAGRQIQTLYIEPGSPWQNGFVESFHGRFRDECLDRELMLSVAEARVVIEDYRRHYNTERPHGGLGYLTPQQAREGLDPHQPINLQSTNPLTSSGPN